MTLKPGELAVVIPAFNDAGNLRQCLEALLRARASQPVEILVVDDASTDGTKDVACGLGLKCIRHERSMGQSHGRNRGAAASGAEFVLFVDSDVVVQIGIFERIEAFIRDGVRDGIVGIQGAFALESQAVGWPSLYYNTLAHLQTRHPRYAPLGCSALFLIRQCEFDVLGRFREDLWYGEDHELGCRMVARGLALRSGEIQFVHLKEVSWAWLFVGYFVTGKMLAALRVYAPAKEKGSTAVAEEGCRRNVLIKWLTADLLLAAALVTPFVSALPRLASGVLGLLLLVAAGVYLADVRVLWRVRARPEFVLAGVLIYCAIPWLVLAGMAAGYLFPAGRADRTRWLAGKTRRKDG